MALTGVGGCVPVEVLDEIIRRFEEVPQEKLGFSDLYGTVLQQ